MVQSYRCRSGAILLTAVILVSVFPGPLGAQDATDPALDLYYNANSLCHRRFYKQAVDEYKRFLSKYPNHAKASKARWGMAISLYNLGKSKEAEPLLAKLVGNAQVSAQDQVRNLRGSCLLELERFAEAEKSFTWTITNAKDPKGKSVTDARVGLVEALYLQKKWTELVKAADAMLKNAPTSRHVDKIRFQQAVAKSKLKQYEPASEVFLKIIETSKDTRLVHLAIFRLAECKQVTGKFAEAAKLYADVAKTKRGRYSEFAHYNLGLVCFFQKEYKKAIEELTAFTQKYQRSKLAPEVRLYLGRAYLETKDYNRARSFLQQLANNSPVKAPATLWLARTHARQGQIDQVVKLLLPAAGTFAKAPELPGMLNELGKAQMKFKRFPLAAQAFAAAAAAAKPPQSIEFLRLQAYCMNRAKQYAESLKLCDAFLQKYASDPTMPEVMFIKAENSMMLKKPDDAMAVYAKFLTTAPQHKRIPLAHFRIAQIHIEKQKFVDAAKSLTTLLAGDHSDKAFNQARFMLADCYFRLEEWDKTIEAFEAFLDETPDEPNVDTAMYNLALACERKGQKEKAIGLLKDLIDGRYIPRDKTGSPVEQPEQPEQPVPPKKGKKPKKRKRPRKEKHPVLARGRHRVQAQVELGKLLYETQKYAEARPVLEAALQGYRQKQQKGDGNAEYYLGWVCLKQDKPKEAANYFARLTAFPKHPFAQDAALQCAILHIRNNDLKSAQATLQKMASAKGGGIKADQAAYYLGLALARQGQHKIAMGYLDTVLTKHPKSDKVPNAFYWRGKCVEKLTKDGPAKAAEIYAQFLAKYADNELVPDVTVDLCRIQYEAKEYDKVIAAMTKLLDPQAAKKIKGTLRENALYLLGWSYFKTGKTAASAKALEEMAAMKGGGKTNASASFQAGEARMRLHEYEEALKHFSRAVAAGKTPTHEPALLRRAECEALLGKWNESERTCREFLKQYPQSKLAAQAEFSLGWAHENRKQYPQAIEQYRKVIARKKNNVISARCQFQIGECLFVSNKLDEAIVELIRVETKYSFPEWSAKAILELGRIREAQNNEDEAIQRYNEVIERFPKSAAATVAKSLLRKLQ